MGCGCGDGSCGNEGFDEEPRKPATKMENGKVVALTQETVHKIKELLEKEGKKGWAIRIEAIPGGCSGFLYNMEFEKDSREGDFVQKEDGLNVFIDPMSKEMLIGTSISYTEGIHGAGFSFSNPNAKSSCGCGKSFG